MSTLTELNNELRAAVNRRQGDRPAKQSQCLDTTELRASWHAAGRQDSHAANWARDNVPALLAEIDALRGEIASMKYVAGTVALLEAVPVDPIPGTDFCSCCGEAVESGVQLCGACEI